MNGGLTQGMGVGGVVLQCADIDLVRDHRDAIGTRVDHRDFVIEFRQQAC